MPQSAHKAMASVHRMSGPKIFEVQMPNPGSVADIYNELVEA